MEAGLLLDPEGGLGPPDRGGGGSAPGQAEQESRGAVATLTPPPSGSQMTFQEICKDVHVVKNQGQQVFIESRVKPLPIKPSRPGEQWTASPLPPPSSRQRAHLQPTCLFRTFVLAGVGFAERPRVGSRAFSPPAEREAGRPRCGLRKHLLFPLMCAPLPPF